jgi:hypothetical protein
MKKPKLRLGNGGDALPVHLGKGSDALLAMGIAAEPGASNLAARTFVAYAAPNFWGPTVTVATHIGVVTYTIDYEAIGDTLVLGRVTYFKGNGGGKEVTEEFNGSTTITTANAVATVRCQFQGVPLGSTVNGSCNP